MKGQVKNILGILKRKYSTVSSVIFAVLLSIVAETGLCGFDLSGMYSNADLQRWRTQVEEDVRWNFENPVLGALDSGKGSV